MGKGSIEREIRHELGCLRRTANAAAELLKSVGPDPAPWHAAAAAKYAADVFMAVENLWKRRCRYLGQTVPEGATSHHDALLAFLDDPVLGKRLPPGMDERLANYLRFRHRFFHGYGYDVSWEKVAEPLALIPDTVDELRRVWEQWLAELPNNSV